MAGHSKWKQIKHKKAVTDARKGKLFSKLVREITLAARMGGPSPETNVTLRSVLERARSLGLPKDNMERALARAAGGGEDTVLEEFLYEALGPGGAMLLMEGITDNTNRSRAEIRKILTDHDARLADPGGVLWNFEKIGVIQIEQPAETASEDAELAIIDAGAKDITRMDDAWLVETEFTEVDNIRKSLEAQSVRVRETGHDYKPKSTVSLSADAQEALEKLTDLLSDHDDVQEVYTNLEVSGVLTTHYSYENPRY